MSRDTLIKHLRTIELEEKDRLDSVQAPIGSNKVKYNTAYYGQVVSGPAYKWCVVFQWWCFQKAGIPTSVFPKSASVFATRDWFKGKGRYFRTPMVGDLVIFKYSHIGFVETITQDGLVVTVEGNRQDRVMRVKHRRSDSDIDGYCRPEYHKVEEDMTKEELIDVLRSALSPGFDTVNEWAAQLNEVKRDVEAIKEKLEQT
jgi:hypothetical protein